MQSYLKDIFCNAPVVQVTNLINDNVGKQHECLTLKQCFIVGSRWSMGKVQELRENGKLDELYDFFVKTWEYDNAEASLKDFGLYNSREIQQAWKRAQLLKRLVRDKNYQAILEADDLDAKDLTLLSMEAHRYPMLLIPIKGFVCATAQYERYRGLQANTSPIVSAVKNLFQKEIVNALDHTEMCFGLARELGSNPTAINTTLWVLGQDQKTFDSYLKEAQELDPGKLFNS